MPHPIFFSSCIGSQESLLEYQDTIEQILEGRLTRGLHFEKLYGADVYSARINQKGRLLFTRQNIDGEQALIFLMALPNHDYPTQAELQRLEALGFQIAETRFEDADIGILESTSNVQVGSSSDTPASSSTGYELVDLMVYDQKLIKLTYEQEVILQKPLPVVIQGAAGSGKTCVAVKVMSSLKDAVESGQQVLYIAPTKELAESVREIAHASLGELSEQISFQSIDELMTGFYPADFAGVGFDAFASWYQDYAKANRRDLSKSLTTKLTPAKLKSLYEEFQVISGYELESDYLSLGQKQSLYDVQIRPQLWQAYAAAYQAHLEDNAQYDKWFVSKAFLTADDNPPVVIVDEAQNFSLSSLGWLQALSANQVCLLMDSNQQKGTVSRYEYAQTHLNIESECLTANFRCPPQVMGFASTVLDLKKKLFKKQKIEAVQSRAASTTEGFVRLLSKSEETDEMRRVFELAKTPQLAVIAPAHLVDEARVRFDTELVLTPEQSAGLQYPYVVLYEPYMTDSFRKMNKHLQSGKEMAPVDGVAVESALKMHYVAVTRAQKGLWVDSHETHQIKALHESLLLKGDKKQPHLKTYEQNLESVSSSDWEKEIKRQIDKGQFDIAERLYKKHIDSNLKGYELLKNAEPESSEKSSRQIHESIAKSSIKPSRNKAGAKKGASRRRGKSKPKGRRRANQLNKAHPKSPQSNSDSIEIFDEGAQSIQHLLKNFSAKTLESFVKKGNGHLLFKPFQAGEQKLLIEKILDQYGTAGTFVLPAVLVNDYSQPCFLTEEVLLSYTSQGQTIVDYLLDSITNKLEVIEGVYFIEEIKDIQISSMAKLVDAISGDNLLTLCKSANGLRILKDIAIRGDGTTLNEYQLHKLLSAMNAIDKIWIHQKREVMNQLQNQITTKSISDLINHVLLRNESSQHKLNPLAVLINQTPQHLTWLFATGESSEDNPLIKLVEKHIQGLKVSDAIVLLIATLYISIYENNSQLNKNFIKVFELLLEHHGAKVLAKMFNQPFVMEKRQSYSLLFSLYYNNFDENEVYKLVLKFIKSMTVEQMSKPHRIILEDGMVVDGQTTFDLLVEKDLGYIWEWSSQVSPQSDNVGESVDGERKNFEHFDVDILFEPKREDGRLMPPPFFNIVKVYGGWSLLTFNFSQTLIRQVTAKQLFSPCLTPGPFLGASPISLMAENTLANQLIYDIFDKRSDLVGCVTWDILMKPSANQLPVLLSLFHSSNKDLLLKITKSNPRLSIHEVIYFVSKYVSAQGEDEYRRKLGNPVLENIHTEEKLLNLIALLEHHSELSCLIMERDLFENNRISNSVLDGLIKSTEHHHHLLLILLKNQLWFKERLVMSYRENPELLDPFLIHTTHGQECLTLIKGHQMTPIVSVNSFFKLDKGSEDDTELEENSLQHN